MWGHGRVLSFRDGGRIGGFEGSVRGVVLVGAVFIIDVIRSGTVSGVKLSISVKDGRRSTVVEPGTSGDSGTGMLLADSMSF